MVVLRVQSRDGLAVATSDENGEQEHKRDEGDTNQERLREREVGRIQAHPYARVNAVRPIAIPTRLV